MLPNEVSHATIVIFVLQVPVNKLILTLLIDCGMTVAVKSKACAVNENQTSVSQFGLHGPKPVLKLDDVAPTFEYCPAPLHQLFKEVSGIAFTQLSFAGCANAASGRKNSRKKAKGKW